MRKLIAALLLTSSALPLHAQHALHNDAPPRYSVSERDAAAKKSGDSRSFFQRMFGPRPTPAPVPAAKPALATKPAPATKPVIKKRPKPKPVHEETVPDASPKVTPKTRPAAKVAPPSTAETTPATTPPATVKSKTGKGITKKGTPTSADSAGLDDATRFRKAKARALEDPHIKDMKNQADSEVNAAEAHKATINYNRALFQKIREVDPGVSDYSGKVEQSMTKRIGSENAK